MSFLPVELPRYVSPTRPKHQLKRSISEMSPPRLHHRPHHHHYHHLPHRRPKDEGLRTSRTDRHLDGPGWSSEGVTPYDSMDESRRGSVLVKGDENKGTERNRTVRAGEVKEEREKSILRAEELSKSIVDLNALSNDTTRRLDSTYYSVLEKLSSLESTIESLKGLATMARTLDQDFKIEAEVFIRETEQQLEGFGNFQAQEAKIGKLKERIRAGREKVKVLGKRLDITREKVEGWEKREVEWQDKQRTRMTMLWMGTAVVAALLLLAFVYHNSVAKTSGLGVLKGFRMGNMSAGVEKMGETLVNETLHMKRQALHALEELRKDGDEALAEDPRLKLFDEL